ncbi:hypothetical protein Scep_001524 [Stephania cephalantha]|uniref:Uncharacterized protein n=1 Tax=Stephania cephalantha TaxID=152367 RepID=A0AAP0L871_9MAGN
MAKRGGERQWTTATESQQRLAEAGRTTTAAKGDGSGGEPATPRTSSGAADQRHWFADADQRQPGCSGEETAARDDDGQRGVERQRHGSNADLQWRGRRAAAAARTAGTSSGSASSSATQLQQRCRRGGRAQQRRRCGVGSAGEAAAATVW